MPIERNEKSSKRSKSTPEPEQEEIVMQTLHEEDEDDVDVDTIEDAEDADYVEITGTRAGTSRTSGPAPKVPPVYAYSSAEVVAVIKAARAVSDGANMFNMSALQQRLADSGFSGATNGANLRRVLDLARKQLVKEGKTPEKAADLVPAYRVTRKGLGIESLAGLLEG